MEKDIRMMIATEIDKVNAEYNKAVNTEYESTTKERKYLLAQSKVLLTALIELNAIQDRIINDM